MDKLNPSKSAQDSALFDIAKNVTQKNFVVRDNNFRDVISDRQKNLSTISSNSSKDFTKRIQTSKNVSKSDYSKEKNNLDSKNDTVEDTKNIKDDKANINQDDKNIEKDKDTLKPDSKKDSETKNKEKTEKCESASEQNQKNSKKETDGDYIYVSSNIIDAINQFLDMKKQGVNLTDEDIKDLFKDISVANIKDFVPNIVLGEVNSKNFQNLKINLDDKNILNYLTGEDLSEDDADYIQKLILDIFDDKIIINKNASTKNLNPKISNQNKEFNLEEEISSLKQELTSDVAPKVPNIGIKDYIQDEGQNLDPQQNDDFMDNYSVSYTVKFTGNVEKMSNTQKIDTNMTQQIQNFSKIIDEINVAYRTNKNTINLKLEPENLGKLSVKINSENGVLNASFYVENERARRAIEEQLQHLKDTLVQQGLNISDINVQVGQQAEDYNLHKNIMEAKNYSSSLDFDSGENIDQEFENIVNPYIKEDMFNDVI